MPAVRRNEPLKVNRAHLPEIAAELRRMGKSNVEIARMFNTSEASIRRALARVEDPIFAAPAPGPVERTYGSLRQVDLACEDFTVISDVHLPLTNYGLLDQALRDSMALGVRTLVIAGDLLNMDRLSRHDYKQKKGGDLPREIREANRFVKSALEVFETIVLCRGNHDERWANALNGELSFSAAMELIFHEIPLAERRRILVSDTDHCYVQTSQGKWLICHTRSYSKQPGKVPADIALVEMCHVAAGHRHLLSAGYAPNGFKVVELGGFMESSVTEYKHLYKGGWPKWQQGYGIWQGGDLAHLPPLIAKGRDDGR